jgi:hypothetical protein
LSFDERRAVGEDGKHPIQSQEFVLKKLLFAVLLAIANLQQVTQHFSA